MRIELSIIKLFYDSHEETDNETCFAIKKMSSRSRGRQLVNIALNTATVTKPAAVETYTNYYDVELEEAFRKFSQIQDEDDVCNVLQPVYQAAEYYNSHSEDDGPIFSTFSQPHFSNDFISDNSFDVDEPDPISYSMNSDGKSHINQNPTTNEFVVLNDGTLVEKLVSENSIHESFLDSDPDFIPGTDPEDNIDDPPTIKRRNTGLPLSDINNNIGRIDEPKIKRARKNHAEPQSWIVKKNQKLREEGSHYCGLKKNAVGKWKYNAQREARKLGPPCQCSASLKGLTFKCRYFTESLREKLFVDFWKLTWPQKKIMVKTLVLTKNPRHCITNENIPRRQVSLQFHLKNSESDILRVCKAQFLSTLGLREWSVLHWVTDEKFPLENESVPFNKRIQVSRFRREKVKEFFNSLVKMESHYCRASSNRLYLEPVWDSRRHVYREFLQYCSEQDYNDPVEFNVFSDVMAEMKISIFRPKKDQCDTCLAFKNGNISEDDFHTHQTMKEEARAEKEKDKGNSGVEKKVDREDSGLEKEVDIEGSGIEKEVDMEPGNKKYVFTMDAEAVFVCPKLQASAVYYKTKLAVHNFTIFNLHNSDGFCFIWDESQGDLSSNVFTTIIVQFIENDVQPAAGDTVILWSDGCNYQNRNVNLSNGLLNLAVKLQITIFQKFLERGHTQMECDAMHSKIEAKFKKRDVFLPSSLITICETARLHPKPYAVKYYQYHEFLDFSHCAIYNSIRPGKKKGDPQVIDIRALSYDANGSVHYKLRHPDQWKLLEQRRSTVKQSEKPPRLFSSRIPIKARKWDDLQALKAVIPHDTHDFYNNLPKI